MKRKTGFWIAFTLILLVMLALLELSKNTLMGFLLAALAAALFALLHGAAEGKGKRALCWLGWLALFAGILFITRPPVRPVPALEGKESAPSQVVVT